MSKEKPYSSAEIKRAGIALLETDLDTSKLDHTLNVLTYWRNAHVQPLKQAEQLLLKIYF